jgi:hypothetical protein
VNCLGCSAEVTNGLALCELCQRKAQLDLEFIPVYFHNLARWKPGRAGSRPVPGSRVLYDGGVRSTGDKIGDRLDGAANMLTTWARALADARPYLGKLLDRLNAAQLDEPQNVAWLCRGFAKYLTSISTTDWCGQFVHDLTEHEEVLRGLTETTVPGWYAGACRHCEVATYVVPGLTWVTCGGCGATTYARDHLTTILDEARPWVERPMRLAEAVVALVDTELSVPRLHKRISKWGERGRIDALRRLDADGDEVGPKRFRLGEVLDVLLSEGQTRLDDDVVAAQTA